MDFGVLPPEVNSGRMYAGAGPGSMLSAASAWGELAAALHAAAAGCGGTVADLSGDWHGPSAAAMSEAAAPYVEWLAGSADQAELAAAQVSAAAAAYEAAFAATVPPPVIAANRSLLMTLIATNILGLNTPAIAATEAHYAQMWAQDAAAMYGYAASAAAATRLRPFAPPPETANQGGLAAQSTAVAQASSGPATSALTDINSVLGSISTILGNMTGGYSPIGPLANAGTGWLQSMQILALAQNVPGVAGLLNGPSPVTGALGPLSGGYISWHAPLPGSAGVGPAPVSAASGRAALVGSLSVPRTWTSIAPATVPAALSGTSTAAAAQAIALDGASPMFSEMALSSLAGRAVGGTAVRTAASTSARVTDRAPDTEALTTATILVIPVGEE